MKEIYSRRSIRKYLDKEIPEDILKEILKAGMNAPSGHNKKPYEFIVVSDKEKLLKLSEMKMEANFVKWSNKTIIVLGHDKDAPTWEADLGATTQNIMLMAKHYDIGTCWVAVTPYEEYENYVRKMFDIPSDIRVYNLISMGFTDRIKEDNNYYNEDKVHYDSYEKGRYEKQENN